MNSSIMEEKFYLFQTVLKGTEHLQNIRKYVFGNKIINAIATLLLII